MRLEMKLTTETHDDSQVDDSNVTITVTASAIIRTVYCSQNDCYDDETEMM